MSAAPHVPVLRAEMLAAIAPRDGGIYVDGTFGAGGYSKAILDSAACTVYGIDRDPDAIAGGEAMQRRYDGRLDLIQGRFGDMAELLALRGHARTKLLVDGARDALGARSKLRVSRHRGWSLRAETPARKRVGQALHRGQSPAVATVPRVSE